MKKNIIAKNHLEKIRSWRVWERRKYTWEEEELNEKMLGKLTKKIKENNIQGNILTFFSLKKK